MNKIKGCPFCGSAPKIDHLLAGTPYEAYFIKCTNEHCGCEIKQPYRSNQEALDAWNNRIDIAIDVPKDLFENNNTEQIPDLKMEALNEFKNKIEAKFGTEALWISLVLIQIIDKDKWKFEEHIEQSTSTLKEIMKFIEDNNELKEIFASK